MHYSYLYGAYYYIYDFWGYVCVYVCNIYAIRYGMDSPGIESRPGARFFTPVHTVPGTHPASYTIGSGSISRG
jgi:hypothetical protein